MDNIKSLNTTLFEALDRLSDPNLSNEELKQEIERSKAITGIASQIIQTGALSLKAMHFVDSAVSADVALPEFFEEDDS